MKTLQNEQNFNSFIADLKKFISFDTTLKPAKADAPFGETTRDCLNWFLNLASSFGLKTKNYDNFGGEVIFGEGEEIGIMGHIDVVPVGNGWQTDPFTLVFKDGYYYGRGVTDDKAPLLMCLYALKNIKEQGVKPKVKFRLLIGTNEESGWKDVEYMQSVTSFPKLGFSPDGNFPLSYSEKGMAIVCFNLGKLSHFRDFKGGTAINAVCDYAECTANADGVNEKLLFKHGLLLKEKDKIVSLGKSAHASHPSDGVNALNALFKYFLEMGENVKSFVDNVIEDKSGLRKLNNEQGYVTLSPDLIFSDEKGVFVKCDMRIPAPLTIKDVISYLDSFDIDFSITEKHPPFLAEKNSNFAKILLDNYKKFTGEKDAKPIALGGSTFARVFEKGYSFGIDGILGESLTMHQPNERISEKSMKTAMEIYKNTIQNLSNGI